MDKVKTFAAPLRIFQTRQELESLDEQVNKFVAENKVRIISASDASTTDSSGATIGLIRVVAYTEP
jgi:hypothetical protein